MNFSPLLRLFYGTVNDYLDGLDRVSPVEGCGSLYELRGVTPVNSQHGSGDLGPSTCSP